MPTSSKIKETKTTSNKGYQEEKAKEETKASKKK